MERYTHKTEVSGSSPEWPTIFQTEITSPRFLLLLLLTPALLAICLALIFSDFHRAIFEPSTTFTCSRGWGIIEAVNKGDIKNAVQAWGGD